MNRTRSRGRLIETAFVSANCSSTEDLDEVDRLANHPVLRSQPLRESWQPSLRKSRSETGEALVAAANSHGRLGAISHAGLSVWRAHPGTSVSNQGSPVAASGAQAPNTFARSRGASPRGPLAMSRLSRSTTLHGFSQQQQQQQQPPNVSPTPSSIHSIANSWVYHEQRAHKSAPSTPPIWSEAPRARNLNTQHDDISVQSSNSSTHYVVQALIENACTPEGLIDNDPRGGDGFPGPTGDQQPVIEHNTPPNTAPLPSKFERIPSNLLRIQQQESYGHRAHHNAPTESSSSNNDLFSAHEKAQSGSPQLDGAIGAQQRRRFRLPLSLKARMRLEQDRDFDSSSAESTPQKRNTHKTSAPPPMSLLSSSSTSSSSHPVRPSAPVRREEAVSLRRPTLDIVSRQCPPPKPTIHQLRHPCVSGFESSCSSAMSSLESLRSNTSDGVQSLMSSESGAVSSMSSQSSDTNCSLAPPGGVMSKPTLEFLGRKNVQSAKFQVLSPISDKSQEQYSETSGNNKTPKVSPSSNTTPSTTTSGGEQNTIVDNAPNDVIANNNNEVIIDNEQVEQALNVPWDVPKLKRRLGQQNQVVHRRTLDVRGSDSGISVQSSQDRLHDVDNLREMLNVPWDMPKLRKRTQQLASAGASRPHSMPVSLNLPASRANRFKPVNNVNVTSSSESNSCQTSQENMVLPQPVPPPPPGFEDSGDEFYMSSQNNLNQQAAGQPGLVLNLGDAGAASDGEIQNKGRKMRPKMTLSFGVDPTVKTLMFATNSPFSLNDCQEVDPNLPISRQEWYHGAINRQEAETILRPNDEGSYLVRNVDTTRQEYALSLKSARGYIHMKIRRDPQARDFQLSNFDKKFMSIPLMVHHYTRNRLPIKGAEHMCLKTPVREQLL